jgi:hypothetical protein
MKDGEDFGDAGSHARAPGEDACEYNGIPTESEAFDPIEQLLAQLAAAADRGSPLSVGRRARVLVRRMPSGFSVERGAGR